jgi:hypothetical protein
LGGRGGPPRHEILALGQTFKIKVEGDTYTQIGVGNPYNEVWKRAT